MSLFKNTLHVEIMEEIEMAWEHNTKCKRFHAISSLPKPLQVFVQVVRKTETSAFSSFKILWQYV